MKKLILAIDIQNEYSTQESSFYIQKIERSLEKIKSIFTVARNNKVPIWHTHYKGEGSFLLNKFSKLNFINGFGPYQNEPVFMKDGYSCFSSSTFFNAIKDNSPEEIMVVGYESSMSCINTILDGIKQNLRFTLIADATASRGRKYKDEDILHQSAINTLSRYVSIIDSETALLNISR